MLWYHKCLVPLRTNFDFKDKIYWIGLAPVQKIFETTRIDHSLFILIFVFVCNSFLILNNRQSRKFFFIWTHDLIQLSNSVNSNNVYKSVFKCSQNIIHHFYTREKLKFLEQNLRMKKWRGGPHMRVFICDRKRVPFKESNACLMQTPLLRANIFELFLLITDK